MKIALLSILVMVGVAGCKNMNKAEPIATQMENSGIVSGTQTVGVKKGEMVVMDKAQITETLRDLQNTVFSLEDKVYGTRKLNTLGLYGELKTCRRKMASRQYGGSGTLVWTEPLDRPTEKEDELKIGLDEKKELVGVTEEYLRDRVIRFQGYKTILQKRSDDFQEQIDSCMAVLKDKEYDADQPSKVMVQEVAKASFDKEAINQFMCGFVKKGASLQSFMINAFAKSWLSLGDYRMDQNLVPASLKDSKGTAKDNALLFSGWRLAFDVSPVTVGDLLHSGRDAKLVAWAYDGRADAAPTCLTSNEGQWNP